MECIVTIRTSARNNPGKQDFSFVAFSLVQLRPLINVIGIVGGDVGGGGGAKDAPPLSRSILWGWIVEPTNQK
ncbi:hypothetical protein BLOT_012241 [Blomia tropicalis]|nr:hypothetical protein BLOT_012241 [Blomia tropicalis]